MAEKDVLLAQEEILRVSSDFGAYEALELGKCVVTLSREYTRGVAVRIYRERDGQIMFSWMADDKDAHNIPYLEGKRLAALAAGHMSLMCFVEHEETGAYASFFTEDTPECPSAGAFPLRDESGNWLATLVVSGLHDGQDHELVLRTLCKYLNKNYGSDVPIYAGTIL